MSLVTVRDLTIRYDQLTAVNGISFEVSSGQAVGLLGGNGAGKSSTLKVLSGVAPLTSGDVSISGYDLTDSVEADKARKVTGYCPDVGGLISQATIREHIGLSLGLHDRVHLWNQALETVERFGLSDALDRVTGGFSHGMSRRLSVVLAVLAADDVLILDEPFDGVDPLGVDVTLDIISEAKEAGLAVLVSTHLQELLVRASDEIIVMNHGSIVDHGVSNEFLGEEGRQRYQSILATAEVL